MVRLFQYDYIYLILFISIVFFLPPLTCFLMLLGAWEVIQCCDGESALKVVDDSKEKFDVIVIDESLAEDPSRLAGHEVIISSLKNLTVY